MNVQQGVVAERIDCAVIGAGVVGLAVAQALARAGREVLVLERHAAIGAETSSRNSEVIHAGIYYPHGSRKARLCVRGKRLLYAHCEQYHVAHRRCGKLIVASDASQFPTLRAYQAQARGNGAGELEWLTPAAVETLEPAVVCAAAVLSPSTGIIDSHAYMLSLQMLLEEHGGMIALASEVEALSVHGGAPRLHTSQLALDAAVVVNCAGLEAPMLARSVDPSAPRAYYARGRYYTYSGASPFTRLIYPVAEPGGLGVHVTLDLAGQARFGPDVQWIDGVDYTFDDTERERFAAAIRRYYPALDDQRLAPGYTGIRPKLAGPGEPAADFRVDGPHQHGVPGLVNLLGIESPGLTASLAIAQEVLSVLGIAAID